MHNERLMRAQVEDLNRQFAEKSPLELLQGAARSFAHKIALCSAFGPEGMVLLHLVSQLEQPIQVFTLDTGRLPQETHGLMQRCEEHYRISIDVYAPDASEERSSSSTASTFSTKVSSCASSAAR
jgi:phosphoadenosine phosphosulfate reductase